MIKKDLQRQEYLSRINSVIDYIDNNITNKFTLDELASVANFSKYHFHRIFSSIIGETLNHYILRIRLEKAATLLIYNPNLSITEIVFNCGFSSSSAFARAFKENFNISASQWRQERLEEFSNIHQLDSNYSEVQKKLSNYFGDVIINQTGEPKMANEISPTKIEIKEIDEFTVAYIRYIGPYKGNSELFGNLFTRLFNWAGPKNLIKMPETKILSVYHDNPEITSEEKLRLSVCLSVPDNTEVEGDVGKMKVSGGKYVVASYEIKSDEYEKAWSYIYSNWFPASGYQPDDMPSFESYLNSPEEHPEKKHIVDIYIPIKPI